MFLRIFSCVLVQILKWGYDIITLCSITHTHMCCTVNFVFVSQAQYPHLFIVGYISAHTYQLVPLSCNQPAGFSSPPNF